MALDTRKPYSVPPTGSLRSWLWTCFLRAVPDTIWEAQLQEAGRDDADTLCKCYRWWAHWQTASWSQELFGSREYTTHGMGSRRWRGHKKRKQFAAPNRYSIGFRQDVDPNSGAYNTNSGWRTS